MVPLPDFLKAYKNDADQFLADGSVGDVEFAGETYQVQVLDPNEESDVWSFIQLDPRGQIKDCFCSCESPDAKPSCIHLAVAFLSIYHGKKEPLHQRFQNSLWNTLMRLYSDRIGIHSDVLKKIGKGQYVYFTDQGDKICSILGKTEQSQNYLFEIIDRRRKETEETSLKFSNLTQEEIASWRKGRPGSRLRYELSYWNDIAKWLMLMQDQEKPYQITFKYGENKLPNWIAISFSEVEIELALFESELSKIILSFATVLSPLRVHQMREEMIEKIVFHKLSGCFELVLFEGINFEKKEGIAVDGWSFVENDGFYPTFCDQLIEKRKWYGKECGEFLEKHWDMVEGLLEGESIYATMPVRFSYKIEFDLNWNLHILSFLHIPGDLTCGNSCDLGCWIYLDGEGFFPVEERLFSELDFVVLASDVADFVRLNRGFFNQYDDYHVHLSSIESKFSYSLNESLKFYKETIVKNSDEMEKMFDFGSLLYIRGRGFYPKSTTQLISPIKHLLVVKKNQIGNFIRVNLKDLKSVENFFSERCPVGDSSIRILLLDQDLIRVEPVYSLYPEYRNRKVNFFDEFSYVDGEGFFELSAELRLPSRFRISHEIEHDNLIHFLTTEIDEIKEYASFIDPRLLKPESIHLIADELKRDVSRGREWMELKLRYRSSIGSVSVIDLLLAKQRKKRFVFSNAGLIDLEEAEFEWLKPVEESRLNLENGTLYLTTLELIKLNIFSEIQVLQSHNLIQEMTEFKTPHDPDLTGLSSRLRPYQMLGVKWLWFLYQHNLSGLLCDDMGLGKTHQAMALIVAIKNEIKLGKFLIICPTSVLYHWQEKLAKFLPDLRICTFYGAFRDIKEFKKKYDILLTSYGIWRIEKDKLSCQFFDLAIFDEVQVAKNHNSRIHHALSAVKSTMRLGLTGTPIENYLRELKALFDLVLPSYMPNHVEYRRMFIRPIEKGENIEKKKLLKKFIHPFILRRRKEEVLVDLPEKSEESFYCDLENDQKILYMDVLEKSRRHLVDELENNQVPIPYIHIFAVLTHLKQVCDHPAVYLKEWQNYSQYQSGKWELFLELLHEALDSRQKVVVYSQFLNMLDIIESYLSDLGIDFAALRGSTRNRGEEIKRFHQDPECRVFVGSLHAAGLGIDLTAASVVIHYDRWWNAARENQATDRIHRIGQVRGVQVFKLITKGTFEERIDAMIARKGKLMEDVIGLDDHQVLKRFDREDLIELLQYIEEEKY